DNLTNSIWEDEDARSFYESLIDLKTLVPGVLLEAKTGKKDDADVDKDDHSSIGQDKDDKDEKEDDDKLSEENQYDENKNKTTQDTIVETTDKIGLCNEDQEDKAELDGEKINSQADIDSPTVKKDNETSNKSGTSAQLDSLLSRLPNMVNRDLIDRAATLVGVPRARLDLLPYYSRLIATLNPHYPDITTAVLQALEGEFKSLQKKKTLDFSETKIKNIRFLSELAKFRITPQHVIFHCLKVVIDDFSNQNIDIACNLLETCGRFLFKSPETNIRMGNMLDIMMRKKSVQHLDNRQLLMIENAYYQCNPPDRTATVKKERSVMEQYIRKLIYSDLNKKTVEK
ncbi:16758_t:CDS:2, partial [Cetraspora pellucida]